MGRPSAKVCPLTTTPFQRKAPPLHGRHKIAWQYCRNILFWADRQCERFAELWVPVVKKIAAPIPAVVFRFETRTREVEPPYLMA